MSPCLAHAVLTEAVPQMPLVGTAISTWLGLGLELGLGLGLGLGFRLGLG